MSLRLEKQGATARLLIDRAEKRNAFTQAMWEAFPTLLDDALGDDAIKVVILQSAAPGAPSRRESRRPEPRRARPRVSPLLSSPLRRSRSFPWQASAQMPVQ